MLTITLDESAQKRLTDGLGVNDADAVRIREYTMGSACRARTVLGLSLERKNSRPKSKDEETAASGIRFLVEQELLEQYGGAFRIAVDEKGELLVLTQE